MICSVGISAEKTSDGILVEAWWTVHGRYVRKGPGVCVGELMNIFFSERLKQGTSAELLPIGMIPESNVGGSASDTLDVSAQAPILAQISASALIFLRERLRGEARITSVDVECIDLPSRALPIMRQRQDSRSLSAQS